MPALQEFVALVRGTLSLWARWFPVLGFWFCLGHGARTAAIQAAVSIGVVNAPLANLVFVGGLVAWVICLVLMISSLGPGLRFDKQPDLGSGVDHLSTAHTRQKVLVHGAAPFLAVYALGGFASEQVVELQRAALAYLGPDYAAHQPVRFERGVRAWSPGCSRSRPRGSWC